MSPDGDQDGGADRDDATDRGGGLVGDGETAGDRGTDREGPTGRTERGGARASSPRPIAEAIASRRRALLVSGMRGLARTAPSVRPGPPAGPQASTRPGPSDRSGPTPGSGSSGPPWPGGAGEEACDMCGTSLGPDHRHLLNLLERRIECACEGCWALRSGDAEYRPTGGRTLWLPDLELPDEVWASFQIPIGLAFFMESTVAGCVVALYPSPGGATESELHFSSWSRMVNLNPLLRDLEPDIEGLVVNRLSEPPAYAIAPIDRCYALTGTIKLHWEGISGGSSVRGAVSDFFAELESKALVA